MLTNTRFPLPSTKTYCLSSNTFLGEEMGPEKRGNRDRKYVSKRTGVRSRFQVGSKVPNHEPAFVPPPFPTGPEGGPARATPGPASNPGPRLLLGLGLPLRRRG